MPGEGFLAKHFYKTFILFSTLLVLSLHATRFFLLPALFSCTTETGCLTKVSLAYPANTEQTGYADIFAFDNDRLMQLDSYMHCGSFSEENLHFRSQYGEKIIFVCTNGQRDIADWTAINSMDALDGVFVELGKEQRSSLCMTGSGLASAGSGETCSINMTRIASEVILRSLNIDFRDRSHEGAEVSDLKAYLINVNTICSITADGDIMPLGIMNAGRLEPDDMAGFAQPDLIVQDIRTDIDSIRQQLDMRFICYPNASRTESPGTPFTRLVIEGKMDGETCWWPIDINRGQDAEEPGIHRNRQYIFDMTLTGKGTSDPDIPIDTEKAEIKMEIRIWNEKDDYTVRF